LSYLWNLLFVSDLLDCRNLILIFYTTAVFIGPSFPLIKYAYFWSTNSPSGDNLLAMNPQLTRDWDLLIPLASAGGIGWVVAAVVDHYVEIFKDPSRN